MLPEWSIVGFAGHRELADPTAVAAKIGAALDRLNTLCGPLATASSAANGADILFLEEARRRKLPSLIILPFHAARFEKDFAPTDWPRAQTYLKNALQVEEISGAASDEEAYLEAGERTVEQADIVIAVWNGQPAAGLGGTADAVAHARMLEKPLIWINPASGGIVEERFDRLRPRNATVDLDGNPRKTVEKHFQELDETATRQAPKARHLIQRIVLIHLFASAVGLGVPTFGLHGLPAQVILLVELGVLVAAFILTSAHRRSHEKWTQNRIEAEICRSFLATWQLRLRAAHLSRITIPGFESLCKNLRLMQCLDSSSPLSLTEACQDYLDNRIRNQINYFKGQSATAHRVYYQLRAC